MTGGYTVIAGTHINTSARRHLMDWLQCKGLKWTRDASTLSMHNKSRGRIRKSEHDDIGARRHELMTIER